MCIVRKLRALRTHNVIHKRRRQFSLGRVQQCVLHGLPHLAADADNMHARYIELKHQSTPASVRSLSPASIFALFKYAPWLALLAAGFQTVSAHEPTLPWSSASYRATKFFLTATAEVSIRIAPAAEVMTALQPAGGHLGLAPADAPHVLTTISTHMSRQQTQLQLWHAADTQMLQRTALYTGRKDWYRLLRYTADGVYSLKRRPRADEGGQDPAAWSEMTTDFYPYPIKTERAGENKAPAITEPEVVFYALAQHKFEREGDHFDFIVQDDGHPLRIEVRAVGTERLRVNYERTSAGSASRVDEQVDVLRVTMSAVPMADGPGAGEVKFLGLDGNVEIFFDPVSRLVLELKGEAKVVGEVRLKLIKAAVLRAVP